MAMTVTSIETRRGGDLAVMLTGGGARAAYQVGLLRGIARHFPHIRFQIITGVSAGALNATFLAAHEGTLPEIEIGEADVDSQLDRVRAFLGFDEASDAQAATG
jgi:NTE family protein